MIFTYEEILEVVKLYLEAPEDQKKFNLRLFCDNSVQHGADLVSFEQLKEQLTPKPVMVKPDDIVYPVYDKSAPRRHVISRKLARRLCFLAPYNPEGIPFMTMNKDHKIECGWDLPESLVTEDGREVGGMVDGI